MKALIIGDRSALNQRLGRLFQEAGFEVEGASLKDEIVEIMANEKYDLALFVAPEEGPEVLDYIAACKDLNPSLHIFLLPKEGEVATIFPRVQPALGKKITINELPALIKEEMARTEVEREHYRTEWLGYAEEIINLVGDASTIREAAKKVVERLQELFDCTGCTLALALDETEMPVAVATAGEKRLAQVWDKKGAIAQWLVENQTTLIIKRARSNVPAIQRELVKLELGSCAFIPLPTPEGPIGYLAAANDAEEEGLSESQVALLTLAAKTLALRMSAEKGATVSEDAQEGIKAERERRQALEDIVGELTNAMIRLAREMASLIDVHLGRGASYSESIARLATQVAEQIGMPTENLALAVYLRDVGMLSHLEGARLTNLQDADLLQDHEHPKTSFRLLSRVRLPSPCLEVARHHHENYDGSGAPDGQKGEQIPSAARLVRVVEEYVSMTASTTGETSSASPTALAHVSREAGKLYDPNMADALVKLARAQGVTAEQETFSLMAHELRNPLTLVSGFTELLANRQDLPEQAKEMAAELQRQAQQMVTLTESLLEISRLQSGRVRLSWQWANVKDIAEDEVKKAQFLSQKHTLRVEAPANPVRLYADATRVAEGLRNLITNAVKYSPAGGEIVVRVQDQPGEVVLSVTDHGIGIPKEKVSQLFQPFYRVQQAETRNIEGLGLGLALTRAIVEAHGGRIWVESEHGKGSTFSFSVPKSETGNERSTTQTASASSRT